jgi:hypothetical protein
MTEAGKAYTEERAAARVHLEKLRISVFMWG